MTPELSERLAWTVLIVATGALGYLLFNRFLLRRAEDKVFRLAAYRTGLPAIVYFTTPTCVPCKTTQRPILEQLQAAYGQWLQVIEIDASAHPDLAHEWGVMTVPTTFVLDAQGRPRYINQGVVSAAKLLQQLELEDYSI